MSREEIRRVSLVSPNLGRPLMLNLDLDESKNHEILVDLLFISNYRDRKELESALKNCISIIPVLEYKWKLKYLIEKKRKEKELKAEKKEKKKGFWARRKEKKAIKKLDKKQKKIMEENYDAQLKGSDLTDSKRFKKSIDPFKRLKPRAFRGDPISPIVLKVKPVQISALSNLHFNDLVSPRDYLLKHQVFGQLKEFHVVSIEFELSEEVIEFFKRRDFVMFDVVHEMPNSEKRINYHSIVVSKKDWENYTFIHATDLHLAERNDRIYGIVKNWLKLFKSDRKEKIIQERDKNILNIKKNKGFSLFSHKIDKAPLKKRLINPNNQFRKFIKIMNKKVLQNELDFIALTGDIIDFTLLSKLPKSVRKLFDFDYEHSNWKVFKEILLNLPQKKRRGVSRNEELLCPIFTTPGNHDYRPFHYDIRWAGMYKKIGLRLEEAIALNDKLLAIPISSITKSKRALRPYLSEVNPALDFSFKLGKNVFIFLNSGSDSWKNFADLVRGHPSVTGMTMRQIRYLENLINHDIQRDDNVFLLLHAPPINPRKKRSIMKRIQQKMSSKIQIKIGEFKESVYKKLGKELSTSRIDGKFNVKFGTVSANWESLITFCKDFCVLTLAGHTHELKEFRLADPEGEKSRVFNAPPFSLKKVENPAAVYYDSYSEFLTNAKEIEKHGPFVVQTPALGMGGYKDPSLRGAYREVVVKKGKLASFKVNYIH